MFKRKIRLINLITGLVCLAVLGTSLVLAVAAFFAERNSLYATTLQLNHETAQKRSAVMDTMFRSMKISLQSTASYLRLSDGYATLQSQLDFYKNSNSYFNSVFVVDQERTVIAASPFTLGITNQKLVTAPTIEAWEAQAPTISKPYMSATNRLIVLMTYPLFDEKRVYRGMLAATIYLRDANVLSDIFGSNQRSEIGSYTYVVDQSGSILFHPDKERLGENIISNPIVHKLTQGQQGHEHVTNTLGIDYLAGFSIAAENGWGIVVQTPETAIAKQTRNLLYTQIVYALPLFILILLITVYLARRLSDPFMALTETAQDLLTGRISVPEQTVKPHWNHEAHHLNQTILLTIQALQEQAKHFSTEAMTDPLTGLANRRSLDSRLARWVQDGRAFSIITLDIDHFKKVNDTYGHLAGDEVLKFVTQKLQLAVRKQDRCSRYGGEEFIVLLPDVSMAEAYLAAERIRRTVQSEPGPMDSTVTVSLGIASYPAHGPSALEVLQAADQALYAAKRKGRNRTEAYDDGGGTPPST